MHAKARTLALAALLSAALLVAALAVTPAGHATPARRADASGPSAELRATVERILRSALAANGAYAKLRVLCDHIGHRLSGSVGLERAVRWAVEAMRKDGLTGVHAEPVMVPKWVRGHESLLLLWPRHERLPMLGLGGSVGTPPGGITAEVVVARNDEELEALGDRVKGRIVLFNNVMGPYHPEHGSGYGKAVRYRVHGPRLAAQKGAVAVLVRSVTARSLRSPHTGNTSYKNAPRRIPAAAVSTEDADRLARLVAEPGSRVRVHLTMGARDEGKVPSANVIGELRGRERPEEIVLLGAHLDSWDVGQGAHDDGAGCVIVMEAVALLKRLGLRPRRTLRVVLFTNEENGLEGAFTYARTHAAELPRHVAAIEADSGGFAPKGFGIEHPDKAVQALAAKQLERYLPLLERLGKQRLYPGHSGADLIPLKRAGVPSLELFVHGERYFDYHHSEADTLDKVDPGELSRSVAAMAAFAYLIAESPTPLGREPARTAGTR